MDSSARALIFCVIFSLFLGVMVVMWNKDYRPAMIAESNRKAFSQVPVDGQTDE